MLASNKLPQLGGETREVTVLFSDIEGFSQIAERLSPDALMALTNAYLSAMTDVIESCGGYVDKYIGDSVVAVFGAPIDDDRHAASAARAALGCSRRLAELNRDASVFRGYQVSQRIGINSGSALVGNFGSQRRFNYSVMSDAVNVASRLEGANKFYGTTIIASDTTVALAGEAFAWRELDTIRVKGRTQSLKIYELMAASASELTESAQARRMADYAAGLSHWRAGEFDLAAALLRTFGRAGPAKRAVSRARQASGGPCAGSRLGAGAKPAGEIAAICIVPDGAGCKLLPELGGNSSRAAPDGPPVCLCKLKIRAGRLDKGGQGPIDDLGASPSGFQTSQLFSWSVQMICPRMSR